MFDSLPYLLLAAAVAGGDLWLKRRVVRAAPGRLPRPVLGGMVIVCRSYNRGLIFGWLQNTGRLPSVIAAVVFAATAALAFILLGDATTPAALKFFLALLIGGAAGNLLDRLARGYVVDYLRFAVRRGTPGGLVGNMSDLCLLAGALGAAVVGIFY